MAIDTRMMAGDAAVKEMTTLERCQDLQQQNARQISQIGHRINQMLDKLRGPGPEGEDGCKHPTNGLLNDHLLSLELEAQHLGAVEADLAELYRLL